VRAGIDGDVVLGGTNSAVTPTLIQNDTNDQNVLMGKSLAAGLGVYGFRQSNIGAAGETPGGLPAIQGYSSGGGLGVFGRSGPLAVAFTPSDTGVYGYSGTGMGVYGGSVSGKGVFGSSQSGWAIHGESTDNIAIVGDSLSKSGVVGSSDSSTEPGLIGASLGSSTGVYGNSSATGSVPAVPAKTGVFGYAAQDDQSRGVTGRSTAGQGVRGEATSGTGGHFTATTGTVLEVNGKATFSRSGKIAVRGPRARSRRRWPE
jgi:hypothetical protein